MTFVEHMTADAALIANPKLEYLMLSNQVFRQMTGHAVWNGPDDRTKDIQKLARLLQACGSWHGLDNPECVQSVYIGKTREHHDC